jgi:Na+-translocating ferredoxin:NAD+ oxidoreductase RnfD subunit
MFDAGHNWWGALPDLGWAGALIIAAAGWYTAARIKRLPVVLVFLGVFGTLATGVAFFAPPSELAGLFRSPDVHAALFFAFFMLDDPPTSPAKLGDQLLFGIIVATSSFVFFYEFGWLYYTLAGLLVGNAWWAGTRTLRSRRRGLQKNERAPDRPTPQSVL